MKPIDEQKALERVKSIDPWLAGFEDDLLLRLRNLETKRSFLLGDGPDSVSLSEFANGHEYYGFHRTETGWVYREWAPNAHMLFLVGDFNGWQRYTHPMHRNEQGDWEIFLEGHDALRHGQRVKVMVQFDFQDHFKIPLYCKRVVQEVHDDGSIDWIGVIWEPEEPYEWHDQNFRPQKGAPLIYEAHVGIAQEEGVVSTFQQFIQYTLPKIKRAGYTAVQLMAIMQHPYYGSFGYHVSNFFAVSSWFGTPDDFKALVDAAHELGLSVYMDLVHSHAVKNTTEGINRFDGTQEQFFHAGARGYHQAWDSMCFDYGKPGVIHFLLSNLKYWMNEYHLDGFRFDGVTSMLFWDHGLGVNFDSYDKYFSMNTNLDAVTYLTLASLLVHELNPNAVMIAEDMSGMPGLCLPVNACGVGFDYRLALGIPDLWIQMMKMDDHDWPMHKIYYELTTRRPQEKKIGYCESHDQALVGDKTLFFWLADQEAYWHMEKSDDSYIIDRAIALHKMIRFITLTTGQDGYLNFIGNEFGHPEWIDFPRAENGWSYHYARRQWHLVLDDSLKYQYLGDFDRAMLQFAKEEQVAGAKGLQYIRIYEDRKIIVYRKNKLIFVYNFHPQNSYESLRFPTNEDGAYRVIFHTDRREFGGYERIREDLIYRTKPMDDIDWDQGLTLYVPSRTAIVLKKLTDEEAAAADLAYADDIAAAIEGDSAAAGTESQAVESLIRAEQIAHAALEEKKKEQGE
ncbi:MAG: alpha amylase C-terminal domain-containing protein [Peptoniphilaceae bacterium]|nr:alpha amylase C-terminal domain-containing protein [Peptoniphilaceae bacterium]MDY6085698.1 alpha amylase C-terminal domain-containing protein [Peptoniphilaceae bacterium]